MYFEKVENKYLANDVNYTSDLSILINDILISVSSVVRAWRAAPPPSPCSLMMMMRTMTGAGLTEMRVKEAEVWSRLSGEEDEMRKNFYLTGSASLSGTDSAFKMTGADHWNELILTTVQMCFLTWHCSCLRWLKAIASCISDWVLLSNWNFSNTKCTFTEKGKKKKFK